MTTKYHPKLYWNNGVRWSPIVDRTFVTPNKKDAIRKSSHLRDMFFEQNVPYTFKFSCSKKGGKRYDR